MHCPNGDNLLIDKAPKHDGLTLHYLLCLSCGGIWVSSFDANYLKYVDIPASQGESLRTQGLSLILLCPQCRKGLLRATGDNVPPDVVAYRCPDGHGYFFPAGELLKFKEAQEVKIEYHQKWHIPLASVASALLMTMTGLIISAGLIIGVIEGERQQTITSQAEEIIKSQKAYVDQTNRAVTIIALTAEPIALTVVVDGKEHPMLAPDARSHVVRITNIAPGDHSYFFRFHKERERIESPIFSF